MYRRIAKGLVLLLALGLSGAAAAHAAPEGTVTSDCRPWERKTGSFPRGRRRTRLPSFRYSTRCWSVMTRPASRRREWRPSGSSRPTERRGASICAVTSSSMTAATSARKTSSSATKSPCGRIHRRHERRLHQFRPERRGRESESRRLPHEGAELGDRLQVPGDAALLSDRQQEVLRQGRLAGGGTAAGRDGSVPVRRAQARRVRPAGSERRVLERRAASEDADHPWRAGRSDAGRIAADRRVESGADRLGFAVEGQVGRAQGDPLREADANGRRPRRPVPPRSRGLRCDDSLGAPGS